MKLLPRHAVPEGNNFLIHAGEGVSVRGGVGQGWVRRRLPVSMRAAASSIDTPAVAHIVG